MDSMKITKKKVILGICMPEKKSEFLISDTIERAVRFSSIYPNLDVSIIMFTPSAIDFKQRKVLAARIKKREVSKPSYFPFPDSIYMRCSVSKFVSKKIEQTIGRKWFNTCFFDKWEGWQLLAQNQHIVKHLPYTAKINHEKDIEPFLSRYPDVFLKPVNLHSSIGIVHAALQKDGKIQIAYIQDKYNNFSDTFVSHRSLWEWMQSSLCSSDYIIQQGIRPFRWNGYTTDIRLNLNKNGIGKWEISALFVRYTQGGSFIGSGIGTGWVPLDFYLTTHFLNQPQQVQTKKSSMIDLGIRIAQALEAAGLHLGDLAIDMCMDENGHLWIFEVNPRPSPFSYPPINDYSFSKPLEYAYFLATNP